jgi:hypothetical protein
MAQWQNALYKVANVLGGGLVLIAIIGTVAIGVALVAILAPVVWPWIVATIAAVMNGVSWAYNAAVYTRVADMSPLGLFALVYFAVMMARRRDRL